MKLKILFLMVLISGLPYYIIGDTWEDPSWEKMLKDSDIIAQVEYTSDGEFKAKAKIINIYKGRKISGEIWISGFSNRFGPFDKMEKGDQYIVFLKKRDRGLRTRKWIREWIEEEPEEEEYYNEWLEGNAYSVWSPTSGDLRIKGDLIQYNLIQTTKFWNEPYHSLSEFEFFLNSINKKSNTTFYNWALKSLSDSISSSHSARYIMMLYLSGFSETSFLYEEILRNKIPESNFALAKLLGQVDGEESTELLVKLLEFENEIVQGEVVRQLSSYPPKFIGPILLSHLKVPGGSSSPSQNIMNPVTNRVNSGQYEIIKTLGEIKYKPAVEKLLPLLETEEEYVFTLIIDVLNKLGSKDYIPYLKLHLLKRTKPLIFEICRLITDNNLIECKPALMEFIKNHNRNEHPGHQYAISSSMGLGHFDDAETANFLLVDFKNFLASIDTVDSYKAKRWIEEYIEVFTNLKISRARPLIYKSLYYCHAYDINFVKNPDFFSEKTTLEDSIRREVIGVLDSNLLEDVQVLAFIRNKYDQFFPTGSSYKYLILVKLNVHERDSIKKSSFQEVGKFVFSFMDSAQKVVCSELNVPGKIVSVRSGSHVKNLDERFDRSLNFSPLKKFFNYALMLPTEEDLTFLISLQTNGIFEDEYDKEQIARTIRELEKELKK